MPHTEDIQFAKKVYKEGLASKENIESCMRTLEGLEKGGVKKTLKELLEEGGHLSEAPSASAVTMEIDEEGHQEAGVDPDSRPTSLMDVEGHIEAEEEPSGDSDSSSDLPEAERVLDLVGQEIGKYKIVGKLGKGGMGEVYRGEDSRLGRSVAVKVLPPSAVGGSNRRLVERFFREARAAAQVVHENIVQVYDMGEDKGFHYIVMQCVDGGSLQDLVRKGALSTEQVIDLILQSAQGLASAEEKQIVHRDIKPSNILVTTDGVAKIADFGLAKNVGTDSNLTYSGQVLGTPHFMSPEQCEGAPTDSRADVYSLGATFYFSLTRRYPFNGETALSVMLKHKTEALVPPTELETAIPEGISRIVQKMMAKPLGDRYQSFKEVLADLERVRQGEEPDIAPESVQSSVEAGTVVRASVVVVKGRYKGGSFNVGDNSAVTVGRDSSKSNMAILDTGISRQHCTIRCEDGKFEISDCGSANGTFVNGARIKAQPLEPNDRIRIGASELALRVLPKSKDALQLVRMARKKGFLSNVQAYEALGEMSIREERGEEGGMAELLVTKKLISPLQAKALCRQLDQKIQVLIMKEQVVVPVPMAGGGRADTGSASGEVIQAPPVAEASPAAAPDVGPEAAAEGAQEPSLAGLEAGLSPDSLVEPAAGAPKVVQMREGLFEGLMFCDQCGDYISDDEIAEGTVKAVGGNSFCSRCLQDSPLLGETLGSYMLWERLGGGRLGSVYRAQDLGSQQFVALKIIRKELSRDQEFVRRLANAVRRSAELKHPNVATVIDTFKADVELVVRYPCVGDRNLRSALLRETSQGLRVRRMTDFDRVAEIIGQTAEALTFAHEKGTPHGEIGPEKILLAAKGAVKVADIALSTSEMLGGLKTPESEDHELVGYLDYRAPELAEGKRKPTFQSDQYSLGGIMHTMVTGKRFAAGASADDIESDVPKTCAKLLSRLIDVSPRRRYSNSRQLMRDIEQL